MTHAGSRSLARGVSVRHFDAAYSPRRTMALFIGPRLVGSVDRVWSRPTARSEQVRALPKIFRRYERRWNAWMLPATAVSVVAVWRQQGLTPVLASLAGGCLIILFFSHPAPKPRSSTEMQYGEEESVTPQHQDANDGSVRNPVVPNWLFAATVIGFVMFLVWLIVRVATGTAGMSG